MHGRTAVIRGYPGRPGVVPGGTLVLHVSTDAPRFRVRIFRWGEPPALVHETGWLPGHEVPSRSPAEDWDWPAYPLDIPASWPSAVYVAQLLEATRGGGCFYRDPPWSVEPRGSRVSLRRPGGGIGGETHGAIDHYDTSSPRQTFAHWDAPFIRWLAANGYATEFCTDLDIDEDGSLLGRYGLLVSVGHDEYCTETTRDRVEAFVGGSGNVAFFGANLWWWRIHMVDDGAAMVCHQGGPEGALDHWWPPTGADRPEDALSGVSYRHGGGWWDGPRETTGFVVQHPAHWVFAGTGLRLGQRFGADTAPPLVGYECDGAPLAWIGPERRLVRLRDDAARFGTPAGFVPVAVGFLDALAGTSPPRGPARRCRHPLGDDGALHPRRHGIHRRNDGLGAGARERCRSARRADHPQRPRRPPRAAALSPVAPGGREAGR